MDPSFWVRSSLIIAEAFPLTCPSTKKFTRYHTPEARKNVQERDQHRETLKAGQFSPVLGDNVLLTVEIQLNRGTECIPGIPGRNCRELWPFPGRREQAGYGRYALDHTPINGYSHASTDCLISLAQVASLPGYVKPTFTDGDSLRITQGRHPMVEEIRTDPFVPNDVNLGGEEPKNMVITGTLASMQYNHCPADEAS